MTKDAPQGGEVPFVDLIAQHVPLKAEILRVVADALDRAAFVGGAELAGFEEEFARFLGVGSSRVDLQACKLEYSIVSPK